MAKERFEDALGKLEKVVSKLEEGDIPLEESLKLFEEGIRLSRFCNLKLDEAEKKVEILLRDRNGFLKPEPFDPSMNASQFSSANSGKTASGDSEQASSMRSGEAFPARPARESEEEFGSGFFSGSEVDTSEEEE